MWQNIFQDVQSELSEPSAVLSFAPSWIVSGLLLVGALAVALIIHAIAIASCGGYSAGADLTLAGPSRRHKIRRGLRFYSLR